MSTKRIAAVLVLALGLIVAPAMATAGMWVGGQIGGAFFGNQDVTIHGGSGDEVAKGMKFEPSVIGGLQIGYYFVNEGFGGYCYPDWMKYFTFATDFTYNRLVTRNQVRAVSEEGGIEVNTLGITNGYMATWSFLFGARYGFFPDSEVPFGRLQPYIQAGPAVLFSGVRFGGEVSEDFNPGGNGSSVDFAVVAEGGVRYFALKCVSLDAGFRYLYSRPKYNFKMEGGESTDVKVPIDMFSFVVRANYHF